MKIKVFLLDTNACRELLFVRGKKAVSFYPDEHGRVDDVDIFDDDAEGEEYEIPVIVERFKSHIGDGSHMAPFDDFIEMAEADSCPNVEFVSISELKNDPNYTFTPVCEYTE